MHTLKSVCYHFDGFADQRKPGSQLCKKTFRPKTKQEECYGECSKLTEVMQ